MRKKISTILIAFTIVGYFFVFSVAHASTVTKTLYAWAKDAAGNVSTSLSDSVTITLASANTYYISPTGNDASGNGSIESPWATLYKACTSVTTSGKTIHVNAGTYNESQRCDLAVGVSIEGEGEEQSIINSTYVNINYGLINLSSSSNGVSGNQSVSNIKIDGGLNGYVAISVRGRGNVSIHDNYISNFYRWGVIFDGKGASGSYVPAVGNTFYNNTLYNCSGDYDYVNNGVTYNFAYGSLALDWQDGILIHDNTINENVGRYGYGIKFFSEGYNKGVKIYDNHIEVSHTPKYTQNAWTFAIETKNSWYGGTEIYNNTIIGALDLCDSQKGNYEYGYYVHDNIIGYDELTSSLPEGIHLEGTWQDFYIENNYIKNVSIGIFITNGDSQVDTLNNLYIRGNVIYNIGNATVTYCGSGVYIDTGNINHNISNVYVDNNTIIGYRQCTPIQGITLFNSGIVTNYYIRNNIIENFLWPISDNNYPISGVSVDNLYIQNNDFYDGITSNSPHFTTIVPTNYTYTGNISANPTFVSSTDFHLQSSSPAINVGINVGLPYNGIAPDIGAFETNY